MSQRAARRDRQRLISLKVLQRIDERMDQARLP